MAPATPSSNEKAILGFIASSMNELIHSPVANAYGDSERRAWLAYARLKHLFHELTTLWKNDRCNLLQETTDTVAEIRWKIRMLDAVDPIAPKAAEPKVNLPLKLEDGEGKPGPRTTALKASRSDSDLA